MAKRSAIDDARELRNNQTSAEALLWSVLRGKQVCGLRFRRQHPVPPFILDFACISRKLCIELDGEYHDSQPDKDLEREAYLKSQGWDTIRFSNEDVFTEVEAVCVAISRHLGIEYKFNRRTGGLSSVRARQQILRDQRHKGSKD